jgi:transposase InsO family protein
LRPWQVYDILGERDLLRRSAQPASQPLKRPPEADHPDQVWHVDLMYLYIAPRWYYLVDILDGYSRFLVHWSLNLTMLADTVTLTVQEALEGLPRRRPGEPKIVHDNGWGHYYNYKRPHLALKCLRQWTITEGIQRLG